MTDSGDGRLVPVTLSARGLVPEAEGPTDLYSAYPSPPRPQAHIPLTAIPYFHWGNREPGPMRIWIPIAEGNKAQ